MPITLLRGWVCYTVAGVLSVWVLWFGVNVDRGSRIT